MKIRNHVVFEELMPGDIVISCNNVLWDKPVTIIGKGDRFTAENDREYIPIDLLHADGHIVRGCNYSNDCVWLVEMPEWRATPLSDAYSIRSAA